jgi:transcriptional regulator with XRE-family HTH domain
VRGAGDHFSVGERIAFYRRRRQLTQRVLAELVGRSEDWLSKVERNERDIRRLDILTEVARALRVSVGDLLGQPVLVEDHQPKEDDVPAVRDALMSHRRLSQTLFGSRAVEAVELEPVDRFTSHAWTNYQQGRLGRVIAALPNLIRSAQALEETSPPNDARPWMVSARIHHLAATTLAKIGEADLAWIAAERAMSAAERSAEPLSLASAARAGTHALLAVGRFDDALNLGQTAADWLASQVDQDDPAALSIAGMLHLRTAIAAAHRQDRSTTTTLLAAAERAANRLGRDANYWQTSFGPTNVQLHRVAASLDLGDVAWVVEHGSRVDASHLPAERSVAHQVDLARAYSYVARDDEALDQLLDAEAVAPQIVRHSAVVRDTVKSLHRRARHSAGTTSPLLGLAERCRAIQ